MTPDECCLKPWFWGMRTETAMKAPRETDGDYPNIKGCGGTHLECGVLPPLLFRIGQKEKQKRRKSAALQRSRLVLLQSLVWGTQTETAMKAPGETDGDYPKIKA